MRKEKRHTGPPEYPETAEGQEAFERFRELTRKLVHVPKDATRPSEERPSSP